MDGPWRHEAPILETRARSKSRRKARSVQPDEPADAVNAAGAHTLESADSTQRVPRPGKTSDDATAAGIGTARAGPFPQEASVGTRSAKATPIAVAIDKFNSLDAQEIVERCSDGDAHRLRRWVG